MPSTDEIRNEIRKTLSDPTPLYALAGAGDLAYEKLREVPGRVEALTADRTAAKDLATARLQEAQTKLLEAQARVAGTVTTLPTDFRALQEKAQTFALQQMGMALGLAVKAKEVYDELAERGKVVVEKGRPGQAGAEGVVVVEVQPEAVEEKSEKAAPAKKATRARKPANPEK